MQSIWKAEFPLYPLNGPEEILKRGTDLYCEDGDGNFWYLDDKSCSGSTLGARRIQMASRGYNLFRLRNPLLSYQELLSKDYKKFIDAKGDVFTYTKTKFVPLVSHKIKRVVPHVDGFVISLEGVHCKFISQSAPYRHLKFAQVLHVDRGFILYGFSESKLAESRKKI